MIFLILNTKFGMVIMCETPYFCSIFCIVLYIARKGIPDLQGPASGCMSAIDKNRTSIRYLPVNRAVRVSTIHTM